MQGTVICFKQPELQDYLVEPKFELEAKLIRVLIADDSEAVRQSLSIMLHSHSDIDIVGLVASGLEAVQRAQELAPHVVIMDIHIPNIGGPEAARRVRQALPMVGILFLVESAEDRAAAMDGGGDGYFNKPREHDELLLRVRSIAAKVGKAEEN